MNGPSNIRIQATAGGAAALNSDVGRSHAAPDAGRWTDGMKTLSLILGPIVAGMLTPAMAINGCLTPESELAARARVVVVGTIQQIRAKSLDPCSPAPPPSLDIPGVGRVETASYPKCGEVQQLTVEVSRYLKGAGPKHLTVFVARQASGLLLACDDRPEVGAMTRLSAVLFLESAAERLWTLDGADSIYIVGRGITNTGVDDLAQKLASHHKMK